MVRCSPKIRSSQYGSDLLWESGMHRKGPKREMLWVERVGDRRSYVLLVRNFLQKEAGFA